MKHLLGFSTLFASLVLCPMMVQGRVPEFEHQLIDTVPPDRPWVKIAGDFDGDSRLDVAIAGSKGPVVWYRNPDWRRTKIGDGGYRTVDGEAVDLDRDGDLDIVIGAEFWFENPRPEGNPMETAWKQHRISKTRTHDIEIADLDGDGLLDLVARDQSSFSEPRGNKVYLWKQVSPDEWKDFSFECPHGEGIVLDDLDGDGDPDLIIPNIWYENTGRIDGDWITHTYTNKWKHADAKVTTADLNNDGQPDVVMTPAELKGDFYRIAWYEAAKGAGTDEEWTEHIIDQKVETVFHSLATADMNKDGLIDVVTAGMHQGAHPRNVSVYLNPGMKGEWDPIILSDKGSHNLVLGDFNNDRHPDILGANHGGDYQAVELWMHSDL